MGANNSTTKKTIDLSSVQETISKSIKNSGNTIGSSQYAKSNLKVSTGDITYDGAGSACTFKFLNSSNVKQIITAKLTDEQVSDLSSTIENQLNSIFDKKLKQVSDAGLSANNSFSSEEIKDSVKSITKSTVSVKNMNKIAESMVTITDTDISFGNLTCKDGATGELIVDNNLIAEQTADAVISSLQENINKNSTLSSLQSKYNESIDQKNEGLFGTFKKWLSTLGTIGIVIGIVIIVIIIAMLWFLLSPAGQTVATNMSGAAAQKIKKAPMIPI